MYNNTMQTAYVGSLVTILILHEICMLYRLFEWQKIGITSLSEDLEDKLLGYPWKLWGIPVQTSPVEGRWDQNWVCSRPTKNVYKYSLRSILLHILYQFFLANIFFQFQFIFSNILRGPYKIRCQSQFSFFNFNSSLQICRQVLQSQFCPLLQRVAPVSHRRAHLLDVPRSPAIFLQNRILAFFAIYGRNYYTLAPFHSLFSLRSK